MTLRHNVNRVKLVQAAGTLLALVLLGYLLHQQGWGEIGKAAQRIRPSYLAAACGCILLSRLATAGRWHILLRAAGIDCTLKDTVRLTFAGLFASNFLPSTVGGDVARLAGAMQLGMSGSQCAASLVLDRLVGMAGMSLVLPYGIQAIWLCHMTGMLPAVPPLLGMAAIPPPLRLPGTVKERVRKAASRLFGAIGQGLRRPWSLLGALLLTGLHMGGFFAMTWCVLAGVGEPVSFPRIAGLWAVVYLATLAPISINGLGVQELSVSMIFSRFGGIPVAVGMMLALCIRTLMMLATLPGAALLESPYTPDEEKGVHSSAVVILG